MPTPLTVKRPGIAPPAQQLAAAVLLLGPLLALRYFQRNHLDLHFDPPWLNFGAHAALVAIPLCWVFLITSTPVQFEPSDEELLGSSTFFDKLPMDWWTMFLTWPAPILAVTELTRACATECLVHPEDLSTSPGRALAIMTLTFVLGWFYATMLLGKSEPHTLVSPAGLRTDLIRFFEWENIHHVSKYGELYSIYHQVNPALPATSFRLRNPQSRAAFEHYLVEYRIPISNTTHPAFTRIKIAVILGFVFNLGICSWLRLTSSLSALWIIVISFGLGIVLTLVLERFRGISKFGRYMPVIEPPDESA